MSAQPVTRQVAQQAARWFLCLQAGASEQQRAACTAWRAAHADHERAWQLAARFSAQVQAIPAGIAHSTLERPAALSRRSAVKALGSLVLLGSLGMTLSRSGTLDSMLADAATGVGERRQLTLEDGTLLHLNTDTAVDIHFSATERLLWLRRGEVMLSTGNDPRPLRLVSAYGSFAPLGTRFAVRQFAAHDLLQVVEGSVAASIRSAPDVPVRIEAGEQALVSDSHVTRVAPGPLGWVEGVLRVERMPLAAFAAELSRYRRGWLRCAPQVAGVLVSGTFQLNDTDAALAALAMTFPVKVRYVTRYWVTLEPA